MFRTSDLPRSLAVHLPWVLSLHHRRPPPLGLRGLDSVLYGCGDVASKNSTKAARHPRFSRSMAAMAVCFPRITSVAGHIFIISKLYCRLLSIVWYTVLLSASVYINPLVKTRVTHAPMLAMLGLDLMCAVIIVQICYWSIHGRWSHMRTPSMHVWLVDSLGRRWFFFCLLGQSVLADDELQMHYSDARHSQQACMAHASLISILIATIYIDLASAIQWYTMLNNLMIQGCTYQPS